MAAASARASAPAGARQRLAGLSADPDPRLFLQLRQHVDMVVEQALRGQRQQPHCRSASP